MNTDHKIFALANLAEAAQKEIQAEYHSINPVIGINTGLRKAGYPADLLTIDDIDKTRKRIILMIHDDQPDIVGYQLSSIEEDPGTEFKNWPLDQVEQSRIKSWIIETFS